MKMRNVKEALSLILRLAVVVLAISCGSDGEKMDEEPQVDELVGTYVFTSANFSAEITVAVLIDQSDLNSETADVTFPIGEDAVLFVGEALVGKAPCTDPTKTAIQLREDGTTFYVCTGESNEAQQGTWQINPDRSVFTLSIIDPAFDVIMEDFAIVNNQMNGRALIPVPIDQSIATSGSLPGGGLNFQNASMDIVFAKIE